MWQMLPDANISRLLARADVDWVCVDCEHGNIDGMGRMGRNLGKNCWTRGKHRVG